ncbi:unnamed protein product [Bursaphelenchus okinawaensis]|uniref:Arginase n=1 Tax=Bursaphelenchus okinawaensis TaxID=465554 RepID=A0A811JW30_9BILA|nr:unnamed protein product [Bursaphelenchus okinawaensis]CAG9085615.1 unnamed protein product [Bursaphelenchus okinawaensis]
MGLLDRLWHQNQNVLTFIGCANGLGGRKLGAELAASAIRDSSILKHSRFPHRWENMITEPFEEDKRQLAALPHIRMYSYELAKCTKRAIMQNKDLCVVGGDHSVAIGTWSGVSAALSTMGKGRLGLVWIDAHLDAHTPQTSESGNVHGMPVAHLLGYGDLKLAALFDKIPKIHPQNLAMVGIRSYESAEQKLLEELNVRVFYMDEIKKRGIAAVLAEAVAVANDGTAGFGMSIDLDGFDPSCAPAVGTPEKDGLDPDEFLNALHDIDFSKLIATELAEFSPELDCPDRRTERLCIDLLNSIYTSKWLTLRNKSFQT